MLKNYNLGAADEIDTQMLSSLAVQAKKTDAKEPVLSQVKKQFGGWYMKTGCRKATCPGTLSGWQLFCMVFLLFTERKPKIFLAAGFCGLCRRNAVELSADAGTDGGSRDPSAVSGTDFAGGWAVGNGNEHSRARHQHAQHRTYSHCHNRSSLRYHPVALHFRVPGMWQGVAQEQIQRETVNRTNEDVFAYCRKHASTLF